MSADVPNIDIRPDHWAIVRNILQKHVPQYEVWAFGSRAKWTARDYSDLDLCIQTDEPLGFKTLALLQEDFSESDLPWKVDIVESAVISASFRKIIERDKVVVQRAGRWVMASEWPTAKLIEFAASSPNSTAAGPFGSNLVSKDYTASGVPVIRGQNLTERFVSGEFVYVSDEKAQTLRTSIVRPLDIVFTQRGTLGQVSIVPKDGFLEYVISQSQMKLTVDSGKAIPAFVYYACTSNSFVEQIHNNAVAAGVPHINLGILRGLEVPLPPLTEQHAIAETLGALDDRIDNLRQTNATLQAIAAALFKSWFVDFDGVAQEDMQESELGAIPKGWRVGTLADLCELKYGKALKATERRNGEIPVYGSGGITGYHDEALATKPTIIVGRKGTVGALYWQSAPCFPIDTVFYVEPKVSLHFCYYAMMRMGLHNLNTDAAVPGLNRDNAYRQRAIIPSADALQKWDAIVLSIRARMDSTDVQAATLATLRDTLLPRLISGRLRVTEVMNSEENERDARSAP